MCMVYRIFAFLFVYAAMAFAVDPSARPEVAVPIPAEETLISADSRELTAGEREDWQKMRAERKAAREQMLSDLRKKRDSEKNSVRLNMEKNRDKKPRFEEGFPENPNRMQKPNHDMRGPEIKDKKPRR